MQFPQDSVTEVQVLEVRPDRNLLITNEAAFYNIALDDACRKSGVTVEQLMAMQGKMIRVVRKDINKLVRIELL